MRLNQHNILIETNNPEILFGEICLWGEACWWPKKSLMRFIRVEAGPLEVGTRFFQKVLLPFGPSWQVQASVIEPDKKICRKFLKGLFTGFECVEMNLQSVNKFQVNYTMQYKIRGFLNKIFWQLFFLNLHNKNIRAILNNLKSFIENKNAKNSLY